MTEIIVKKRGGGKTTQLIELSAKTGAYIVCYSHSTADYIMRTALESNLIIPLPITYDDFINKRYYGAGIKGFLFDDVECFLQNLTTVPILAITASDESIQQPSIIGHFSEWPTK